MSADLYLYFFRPDAPPETYTAPDYDGPDWLQHYSAFWDRVHDEMTGNVWIGQFGGYDPEYGPAACRGAAAYTETCPILTPTLATAITVGFSYPHTSRYEQTEYVSLKEHRPSWGGTRRGRFHAAVRTRGVEKARTVKRELTAHLGDRVVPYTM